jgi:MFS family permease
MVAFCSMVGEGAMADWSALYLRDVRHTSESFAAAGYAAFSIAMAVGRFSGDSLSTRFGPERLVRFGAFSSTIGLLVALLLPGASTVLVGFAGVGFGFSTIVPLVFSAAGRDRSAAPGVAVASVTTIGYLGFIAGPPLIGCLAEIIGLRGALGILIATTLGAGALAPAVEERRGS